LSTDVILQVLLLRLCKKYFIASGVKAVTVPIPKP
jgi:hypothetical protein